MIMRALTSYVQYDCIHAFLVAGACDLPANLPVAS